MNAVFATIKFELNDASPFNMIFPLTKELPLVIVLIEDMFALTDKSLLKSVEPCTVNVEFSVVIPDTNNLEFALMSPAVIIFPELIIFALIDKSLFVMSLSLTYTFYENDASLAKNKRLFMVTSEL